MNKYTVLDLFSGAGGMSYGFHKHVDFSIVGAVDAQNGKPSSGKGTLECNKTYENNIGIAPLCADLSEIDPNVIRAYYDNISGTHEIDVLISCAPCTGFSRTIRRNLVEDDPRNSLVRRTLEFVKYFMPKVLVMENVGELLSGKFSCHYEYLREGLIELGYNVHGSIHNLERFGLPQTRRRALILACKGPQYKLRTLEDLWMDTVVSTESISVRRTIEYLPELNAGESHSSIPNHASPSLSEKNINRLNLMPKDGGEWPDLLKHPGGDSLLIPSMMKYAIQGKVGPHRDVYGRMWWDRPSVTIKRECSHIGNGRYAHPEQNRLCSVREMASLQGFPSDFIFTADSLGNMYRHIGDAVPPLISYQLAHVVTWILTGKRPDLGDAILAKTNLKTSDLGQKSGAKYNQLKLELSEA